LFYAHINEKGEKQTLEQHLIETAERAKRKGEKFNLSNLLFLIGLLHDLGKYTTEFQSYLHKAFDDPNSVKRGEVNHSSAGGKLIFEKYYNTNQIQKITAQLITMVIFSHHGIYDCIDLEGKEVFMHRINPSGEIYYDEVLENSNSNILAKYDLHELFERALQEMKKVLFCIRDIKEDMDEEKSAFFLIGCLERLLLSVLIDADHFNTAEFMHGLIMPEPLDAEKLIPFWNKLKNNLELKLKSLKRVDKISQLRKQISEECMQFGKYPTGIYCLQIATGGGKTLSSLRYALEHATEYRKERIIYVAPYLSILEQNADEYRKALKADEHILEHHSNIIFDETDEKYNYMKETWDSPIILTTMVQLMNVLFDGGIQNIRRMNALVNSVLIIDEIQSLPVNCISCFNTMMNFLSRIGNTTVILCSATQPLLDDVEKKILYSNPKSMTKNIDEQFLNFKRTEVVPAIKKGGYNRKELIEFIMGKIEIEDSVLVILNTKSAVRNIYSDLIEIVKSRGEDIEIYQLTTYMCAENRSNIIKEIKNGLDNKKKLICISTQLIEAGVDISFSCVIRSLAGLDSIIQAAGRCNRNGKADIGYVYIINYAEENLSNLKDIKLAQNAMMRVLDEYAVKPENFNYDLQSTKAMNIFYEEYFYKRRDDMDYKIINLGTNLYDLLSINSKGSMAYKHNNGKVSQLQLKQAFKSAYEEFQVIGSKTIGLLVPYKRGSEIINKIKQSYDIKEIKQEIKKMQRYTVNIIKDDSMIKKLVVRNAIDNSVMDGQILILREGFYDERIGVSNELEDYVI